MANRRRSVWPWATCLWPGLPQLWWRGDSLGLAAAVLLAMLLNLCIAASWVWPELLSPGQLAGCWLVASVVWLAGLPWSWWAMRSMVLGHTGGETQLIAAQTAYLRGNWVEAETLLKRQLTRDPRDIESRLLLAAVCRRSERWEEAQRHLRRLSRLDEAEPWRREIAQEQQRIAEILSPTVEEPEVADAAEPEVAKPAATPEIKREPIVREEIASQEKRPASENKTAPSAVESAETGAEKHEENPPPAAANRHAA